MTATSVLAWHFGGKRMRDGRPFPADGETLRHIGPIIMCKAGLHASMQIIHAVLYAPGNMIFRVECGGVIETHTDKLVCTERTILWRIDGEKVLREFARWCALSVIDKWNAPKTVQRYLETGDESIRNAARNAARNVTWDATRYAAWAAAWSARNVTWYAARYAAWYAARYAAQSVREAARNERDATWDAARAVQNAKLTEMVEKEHQRIASSEPLDT